MRSSGRPGSLAPSELRAEKPDDVLFGGSAGRTAADFCEVELLFDNADQALPGLDFSEVSIVRRLHRGGEGQYLVNGAQVRRIDVVELLADVGLGPGAGSIVSQGKVEAMLDVEPAERRALVEEAAGLGRFKRRRHRAELKLARVAQQVERARDLEAEVAKRLRPLALQATAAERAEKLAVEIAGLRAGIATIDLAELGARTADAERRGRAVVEERRRLDERLEALLARARAGRGGAGRRRRRPRGRGGGALPAAQRPRAARAPPRGGRRARSARLREPIVEHLGEQLLEQARIAEARAAALAACARRARGPAAGRPGAAEGGERLALGALDVEPGSERAVAAALGHRRGGRARADARARARARRARPRGRAREPRRRSSAASRTELVAELPRSSRSSDLLACRLPRRSTRGGHRLRPGSRRAVVRRRDGGGGPARARGAVPAARRRRLATSARGQAQPSRAVAARPIRALIELAERLEARARTAASRPAGAARRRSSAATRTRVVARAGELAAELRALGATRGRAPARGSRRRRARIRRRRRARAARGRVGRGAAPARRGERGAGRGPARRAGGASSSGSSAGASSSAASTRSRRRSTSGRRSTSTSCARSARISSARSTSSTSSGAS